MTDLNRYIDFHHEQDCCERVYVDLEHLDAYDAQLVGFGDIVEVKIDGIKGEGLYVHLYNERGSDVLMKGRLCVFLACRNEQNGYYSDNLSLVVNFGDESNSQWDLRDLGLIYDDID